MKKVLTYIVLTLELTVAVVLLIASIGVCAEGTVEFDDLAVTMMVMEMLWIFIIISGFLRVKYGKKFVILPGIFMLAASFCVAAGGYTYDVTETGAIPVGVLVVMGVIGFFMMRRQKARAIISPKPANPFSKFDIYKAKWAWDDAAKEFCEQNGMSLDMLTDREKDQIFVYTTGYIAYLFAWIVKRDLEGPLLLEVADPEDLDAIRQEKIDPAKWLYEKMDGTFTRDDASAVDFLDYYYPESYQGDGKLKRPVCYDRDYEEIVIAGSSRYWCRDFSWETYRRMEERLDLRYRNYWIWKEFAEFDWVGQSGESGRKAFSESLGKELAVAACDGVPEEYVQRCIGHCSELSGDILGQICKMVEEYWNPLDGEAAYTPERLKEEIREGYLVIPKPYGEDIAYLLFFEAEFESEHGICILVRRDIVIDIGYQADAESPWNEENEQKYRRKLAEKTRVNVVEPGHKKPEWIR